MTPRYALLIPVKDGHAAKSRLGVGEDGQRALLMEAFARDSISAATRCERAAVHLVGDPVNLAALAGELRVPVIPDEGAGDLNRALLRAAERVGAGASYAGVAVMLADLPCLRTEDLSAALDAVAGRSFVADAAGTGTTFLVAPAGEELDPRFGAGSCAAHLTSGAIPLQAALASLRLDVDTTADLEAALRFGVGEHTARAASGLV